MHGHVYMSRDTLNSLNKGLVPCFNKLIGTYKVSSFDGYE
jgi:hypothetical protein